MPAPVELAQEFVIDNLETLKVVAHSLRLDILQTLKKPKSVKEIAKQINRPATKLYYHVNLMEEHGLIRVVETNIVSGIVEKKYQVVAKNYGLQDDLLAKSDSLGEDVDRMLGAIFDMTRTEIRRSIEAKRMELTDEDRRGLLWRSMLCLTAAQFNQLYDKLEEILKEVDAHSNHNEAVETAVDQQLYGLTVAFYPVHRSEQKEDS